MTQEQKEILKKINENSTPLDKTIGVNKDEGSPQVNNQDSPSLEKEVGGLHNPDNNSVEKHNTMPELEEVQAEVQSLRQELRISKAGNAIAFLNLDKEKGEAISKALSVLTDEDQEVVIDTIKSIKDAGEEALTKALEGKEGETPENPLAKALQNEEGDEEESEPLSFVDEVIKSKEDKRGEK